MNYKVLYRKYRPNSFDTLIGQNHIINILKNSIIENKIAHAYLFSGPRGTGKTSTARILAKSINCLNNVNGSACGECESCQSFSENPDIIEIDAASNNGVDEIRELINNVKIMPTSLKYKVYIIDEVHMLSQSAFNALLLTLEEPPEHVVFILATTNLESVPITIVSRCQRFDFQKIDNDDILNRLKYVCKEEKIEYDDDGLKEIALLSDGGLRDALSILDQLSKNNEKITMDLVNKDIGSIPVKKISELIKSINDNDINNIEIILNDFQKSSLNYKIVIKKIIQALSETGVKIIDSGKNWNLTFDDCKNIIFELNDLMNKISVNVDPYLLIKMVLLSYVKLNNNNKKEENFENKNEEETTKIINDEKKAERPKVVEKKVVNNDFVNVRINNCFVNATKMCLNEAKSNWKEFVNNCENAVLKGLISDTTIVAASDKYLIISSLTDHMAEDGNLKVETIEKSFNKIYKSDYKLVFISEDKWIEEKKNYINNLKNNYEYSFIEEQKEDVVDNTPDISDISDVFDINKIEVE